MLDTYIYTEPTAKFRQFMLREYYKHRNTDSCPKYLSSHFLLNRDHMEAT